MPQTIKQNKRDTLKLNLMVVGESGLGKTTFLNSLLGRYVPSIDVSTRRAINEKTNHISQIGTFEILTESGDNLVCDILYTLITSISYMLTNFLF